MRHLGFTMENQAVHYLQRQGLTLITRNYCTKIGEIDIIMREKNTIVFIEVRTRTSGAYGGASQSITPIKKQKCMRTAMHYLSINRLYEKHPVRFDVVLFEGKTGEPRWIRHAFEFRDMYNRF